MWMRAQADFIALCHMLCNTVWAPRRVQRGVKLHRLQELVDHVADWRQKHMSKIGVPNTWPQHWDFVAAISACTSEKQFAVSRHRRTVGHHRSQETDLATLQMMWISMFLALEEHGIDCEAHELMHADQLQRTIYHEALQWSLRLSDLAQMLVAHGYLRLDGNMIRVGLQYAG